MSKHLYLRKRILESTRQEMLRLFKEGRKAKFDVAKAKRFATHVTERDQQGSYWGSSETFRDLPSVHGSVYTYDRLVLEKPLPVSEEAVVNEAIERMDDDRLLEFTAACNNLCRLVRQADRKKLERLLVNNSANGGAKQWAKIRTGSDLFIHGMGGFDIERAWRTMFQSREMVDGEGEEVTTLAEGFLPARVYYLGICTPNELRLFGYILRESLQTIEQLDHRGWWRLCEIADAKRWDWLARHWRWLVAHFAELDELPYMGRSYGTPIDWNMTAAQLINLRNEQEREARRAQNAAYREANKPRLYESVFEPKEFSVGTIRPLAGTKELQLVAKKLKNCAASYNSHIKKGVFEMLALWEKNGEGVAKPTALAAVRFTHKGKRKYIEQLRASCNKPVSKTVLKAFSVYLDTKLENPEEL